MRNTGIIIWLICFCGCSEKSINAPVISHKPDSLYTNIADSMVFSVDTTIVKDASVYLLTTRQPVPLRIYRQRNLVTVMLDAWDGFCEGPAVIACTLNEHSFYYPLQLVYRQQDQIISVKKDYRSPKTVNPDSSLLQQRILFNMDKHRIILPLAMRNRKMITPFYYSDSIALPPVTATYLVDTTSPVTSIYVQPGTNNQLQLSAKYNHAEQCIELQTSCLKDRVHNIIADGTLVAFIYRSGNMLYRTEAAAYKGIAAVKIPSADLAQITAEAMINDFHSKIITVTVPK